MNAPLRGSRVILSSLDLLADASMALYPPMLLRPEEEAPVPFRLELAAAKSLKEFCLANSLKAVSKVHGVVGVVERTISSEGAYVTSGT